MNQKHMASISCRMHTRNVFMCLAKWIFLNGTSKCPSLFISQCLISTRTGRSSKNPTKTRSLLSLLLTPQSSLGYFPFDFQQQRQPLFHRAHCWPAWGCSGTRVSHPNRYPPTYLGNVDLSVIASKETAFSCIQG